jgi:DNA-binding response OmpR family regulator
MPDARILLIEDDREIAATLRSVLQAEGYTVEWVQNGKEGKRVIDEWNPDLVITDMMMPQLGGFPVLDHLNTLPVETRPRVIMITANEGGRHKAFAELMGVDDYLRKPFAMDLLKDAVSKSLAKKFPQDDPKKPRKA